MQAKRPRLGTHSEISQHNSTNKNNTSCLIQARGHEGSNATAREHKVSGRKSISVQIQGYKGALRRLAQTQHDRKGEASCLGTAKILLVNGELDIVVGSSGDCPAPRLQRRPKRPIRQSSKNRK